ncbi:hypothetical protein ACJMK2_016229 [Sinanodonta woodiana]|uniref:Uncharacterized protein n=1 Tax=Sinanodonta woodiana TaxID=1069815 RepID=A0ABD3UWG0_SINWO
MSDYEVLLQSSEFQNFLSVQLAFRLVATELHKYVDTTLKAIHQDIYTECSNCPPCQNNCSETWKETHRWCETCKTWKKNISKLIRPRGRKIDWDKMRSHEWPHNYIKLGKIFAHQCWEEGNLNDVPTYLGIIESCNDFRLPHSVLDLIKKIKDARNAHIGHNVSLALSDNHKTRIFKILKQFVSVEEVKKEINGSLLLQALESTEKGRPFQRNREVASRIQNIEEQIQLAKSQEDTEDRLDVIRIDLETLENDIGQRTVISDRDKVAPIRYYRKFRWPSICIIVILFLLSAILFPWTGKDTITGCLSEDFSYPYPPDIYLSHYIKDHSKIVGREWLLQNISETVFEKQFISTGILLVAEMGFGKSALVSHIVCAETTEPGGKLRARLLAYHVCRFDALNTKRADIFIRRLTGMIANSIPQFASELENSHAALSHLNSAKCNSDPVGCMDQSIVYTLSKVESSIDPGQTWIIVIDALDECEYADTNTNEIIAVLERTADRFPKWIKFFCTARNISTIVRRLGDFRRMEIASDYDRNKRDIHDFVRKYVNENQSVFQKLSSTFILDNTNDIVDRLCEMSSGNFLYIRHALEYLQSEKVLSVENIPNTLEKIYQLNFERIYGKMEERFYWARKVLEILCASIESLKKETVFDMMRFESTNISKNNFSKEMHTLMHFVSSDERLSFTHISIYHWLTDIKREGMPFFIKKEVGHNLMARYMFNLVNESNKDSDKIIINLALHVSESKRQDFISSFKSLPRRFFHRQNKSNSLLHTLAKTLNSYLATELCLFHYHIKDVDLLNADNLTAAFIAAGRGNVETLRALLDNGAEITFRISLPALLATVDDAALVIKTRTFWGYGLLDIAAQHGHVDTVRLLLSRKKSMADVVNDMNVKPHHLACEFGHANVLDIFLKQNPRFADQMCLYKAASNGHTQIIRRLLALDVRDVCIQCNGSFYWLKETESRMQSPFFHLHSPLINNFDREMIKGMIEKIIIKRKPFNDMWTISCETALHISSRLGFTDSVRLLMSQAPDVMTCRDRAGRTPFLTAVIHNRTDIAELLYPLVNSSNKCLEWNLTQNETTRLNIVEINKLSEGKCPNGSSVVHLIARYGLTNLAQSSVFRDMDWEEEDMEGCRPIHHAACHAGLDMLVYLYRRKVDFFSRTKNGSTAFHIAALCRPFNLHVMYHLNSDKMPPLFDNLNRSILQYMFMHPLSMDSSHALNSISERIFLMGILFSEEHIMHVDSTGANILHYVMKHGYFNALPYLYNKYQDIFFKCILQNDNLKHIPLDEAFCNLPYDERIVRKPYNCSMDKVISYTCDGMDVNDYIIYMSPTELTIFFFVTTVSPKVEYHRYFKQYVHEAIKRSNVYVTLMFLTYFNAHSTLGTDGFNPLTTFTSLGNNPIMAELFLVDGCDCLKCGTPIEKSPLHQMSLNMNNSFWFVDCNKVHNMIKNLSTEYIGQCVDNEGFNVLQRAVEGGNYELAKCYFDRGVSLKKNNEFVLQYVLLGAMAKFPFLKFNTKPYELKQFNKTKYWHSEFRFPEDRADYDKTTRLSLRFMHKSRYLMHDVICQNTKATLSLVHLAAANGLLESLEYIVNRLGKKALLCQNTDLISPIYLAYVFNQSRVIRYLEKKNITLNFPKHKPELYLSFILLFDVNKLHQRTRHCLRTVLQCVNIINYSPHNYFVLVRASSCLKIFSSSDFLPKWVYEFKKAQKIMANLVRLFLTTLCMQNLRKSDGNNNCLRAASGQCIPEFPQLRTLLSQLQLQLKNSFSVNVLMETLNQHPTIYTMKWLFDRWNVIMQNAVMNKPSIIKYFEIVSSVIEPVLGNRFAYLRTLTLVGRYNQLKTVSDAFQHIANITNLQLSFELPRIMMDDFKPLNDMFNSQKRNN